MAATTFDKVLPPAVFLTALLGAFLIFVNAMNPTIESNLQMGNTPPPISDIPDFQHQMFTGNSETFLTPNPFTVSSSMRTTNWPVVPSSPAQTFTSAGEPSFSIRMYVIGKHVGDISGDRHELNFQQTGGWLGIQHYGSTVGPSGFFGVTYANGTSGVYMCHIQLRHTYDVFITNGPGNTAGGASINNDYYAYNYNISIGYESNLSTGTNAWAIIAGLFTFNLPGVPFYITALIMAPIMVTIALVAYIIVRSALPA